MTRTGKVSRDLWLPHILGTKSGTDALFTFLQESNAFTRDGHQPRKALLPSFENEPSDEEDPDPMNCSTHTLPTPHHQYLIPCFEQHAIEESSGAKCSPGMRKDRPYVFVKSDFKSNTLSTIGQNHRIGPPP